MNIHKHRNKACKQLRSSQQRQERHQAMAVDIRLPEAHVWMRPFARTSSDTHLTHLRDYGPDVHQLFHEIVVNAQHQQRWPDGRVALDAENDTRNRFLLWVYRLPMYYTRYRVPLCLFIKRLVGNTLNKLMNLVMQLAILLYLLIFFVYYCIGLVVIVAVLYIASYTLSTL